ncbi:unnamed protein product [Sphenostylis stenocarpa]|uniref:Uncharacterized protein n=1 Tax=Sphenostylis stenocarpa TaxID=92480 RepID=A0AA86W505_9FABA|nr:unnamed protein product [Sphenostylis stenocarpa]
MLPPHGACVNLRTSAIALKHQKDAKDNEMMEGIQRWREALTRVANHSGWDIRNKYVIPSGFSVDLIVITWINKEGMVAFYIVQLLL